MSVMSIEGNDAAVKNQVGGEHIILAIFKPVMRAFE